jgi:hypothetical protein
VLELCREAESDEPAAVSALERWDSWRQAIEHGESKRQRRFRRRSYERARDGALGVLLMRIYTASTGTGRRTGRPRSRDRSPLAGRRPQGRLERKVQRRRLGESRR